MALDHTTALAIAQRYFGTTEPLERLGWGISGFVYLSPDLRTAVKVHRYQESFEREVEVYRILRKLRISRVQGLTVPKLRDARPDVKVIAMDAVSPPYLLDFAGVKYSPPDFSDDTMAHWHAEIDDRYGPNAWIVYAVYAELAKRGLYYMDFRQTNLNLKGLPGLLPHEPTAEP